MSVREGSVTQTSDAIFTGRFIMFGRPFCVGGGGLGGRLWSYDRLILYGGRSTWS